MLKFHEKLIAHIKDQAEIQAEATKIGLSALESTETYRLIKTQSKKTPIIPERILTGHPYLIGAMVNGKVLTWLYFEGRGVYDWYKTSPIASVTLLKTGFEIETENSNYIIEKVKLV